MPDALADVVGSWAVAGFGGVAADDRVPFLGFEGPDAAGEEAGGDEVENYG